MKRTCRTWRECASLRELQSLKALSSHPQIVALFEVIRETDETVYFVVRVRTKRILYMRKERRCECVVLQYHALR